jgi:hypothetical protein
MKEVRVMRGQVNAYANEEFPELAKFELKACRWEDALLEG